MNKNLDYYQNQNKVFWVVNADVNQYIKANSIVPCIFVKKTSKGKYLIIQLDEEIKNDQFKYTAWRKFIGISHGNIRIDILLIHDDKLYTLDNQIISFDELGRSSTYVNKKFLAPFDYQN